MKITMADIAKAAEVSVATVGRVVQQNGYVSAENRKKVEEKIAELGYVPNRMARMLKSRKSGLIGSLVTHNVNYLYERINQSVITAVEKTGYELLTLEGRFGKNDECRLIEQFIGLQVEGLVIISNDRIPSEMFMRLHAVGIPVVAVERCYDLPYVDNLYVNDFGGTQDAVRRIIGKGHKNVALIACAGDHAVEKARLSGYRAALEEAGIPHREDLVKCYAHYQMENGYDAMKALYTNEAPPTAVFATADVFLCGALQFLYEEKQRVPEDISLVGYDNVMSQMMSPPIDSVDLAVDAIGPAAMDLLQRRMENQDMPAQWIQIDTVYVNRNTVKVR